MSAYQLAQCVLAAIGSLAVLALLGVGVAAAYSWLKSRNRPETWPQRNVGGGYEHKDGSVTRWPWGNDAPGGEAERAWRAERGEA